MTNYLSLLMTILLSCSAAIAGQASPQPSPGTIPIPAGAEYELIGTYDVARLNHILNEELDAFMASSTMPVEFRGKFAPAKYSVKLYLVKYRSVIPEHDNQPTLASGLVAIPETGGTTFPLVSYQHGTIFDRTYVPSNPDASMETRIILAQFAAQGYIVIGADYFGRGLSELPDSYLVRDSSQQAGFDLFLTARDLLATLNLRVSHSFVSGWSQGGWVTMQYLHNLQSIGVPVSAAGVASAPVDVYLTMNRWMNNPHPIDAVYLPAVVALQLQAQEYYHRQVGLTESAIRPEYLQAARDLYKGRIDWDTFRKRSPAKLQDFIKVNFRKGGFTGETPYWQVLQGNQAYRWRSTTPMRVYYGGMDEVTPTYIAELPENTQRILGGEPAQSINAGSKADHRSVFIFGVIDQKKWFDELVAAEQNTRIK